MGVMAIDSPGGEDALGETILARSPDVIHDLVAAIFDDRFAKARGDIIQNPVPGHLFPFALPTFAGALEWIKNAVRILNLVEGGGTLGTIAPARSRMFGIAFKLLDVAGDFVDVGEQAAGRLAVETSCRDQGIMALFAFGPGLRIEFCPIIPTLFWRKRSEMTATGAGIERFAARYGVVTRSAGY